MTRTRHWLFFHLFSLLQISGEQPHVLVNLHLLDPFTAPTCLLYMHTSDVAHQQHFQAYKDTQN